MKIVIFLCDRYGAHRSRGARGECDLDRSGGPFTRGERSIKGGSVFYGDSEVLVGEHDEGYCAQQWNRGDVGRHKGCLHKAGGMCGGGKVFRHRLDDTGNVSRSGVWGKQVVRGGIGVYGSRYLLSNVTNRASRGERVVWRGVCRQWIWLYTSSVWGVDVFHTWR